MEELQGKFDVSDKARGAVEYENEMLQASYDAIKKENEELKSQITQFESDKAEQAIQDRDDMFAKLVQSTDLYSGDRDDFNDLHDLWGSKKTFTHYDGKQNNDKAREVIGDDNRNDFSDMSDEKKQFISGLKDYKFTSEKEEAMMKQWEKDHKVK